MLKRIMMLFVAVAFMSLNIIDVIADIGKPQESQITVLTDGYSQSFDDEWSTKWYSFTPETSGFYTMTVNTRKDDYAYITLYDSSENQLASIDTDDINYLSWNLTAGQKYYYKLKLVIEYTGSMNFKAQKEVESLSILDPLGNSAFHRMFTETEYPLSVTSAPDATKNSVIWSVSDDSIATVSSSGVLKGLSEGTVTVMATSTIDNSVVGQKNITFYRKWDFDFTQSKYYTSSYSGVNSYDIFGYLDYDTYEFNRYTNCLKLKNFTYISSDESLFILAKTSFDDSSKIHCYGTNSITSNYVSDDGNPGVIIDSNRISSYIYCFDNASLSLIDNGYNNGIETRSTYQVYGDYNTSPNSKVTINVNGAGINAQGLQLNNIGLDITAKTGLVMVSSSGAKGLVSLTSSNCQLNIDAKDYGINGNLRISMDNTATITANASTGSEHGIGIYGDVYLDASQTTSNLPNVDIYGSTQAVLLNSSSAYLGERVFGSYANIEIPTSYSFQNDTIIDNATGNISKRVKISPVKVNVHYGTGTGNYETGERIAISASDIPGYEFKSWYVTNTNNWTISHSTTNYEKIFDNVTDINEQTVTINVPDGRTYLEAQYDPITYTIKYYLAFGTVSGTNPTTYTIASNDITLINPTRSGYAFMGWQDYDNQGAGMFKEMTIPKGSIGDKTFVANWSPITFTINEPTENYFTESEYRFRYSLSPTTYIDDPSAVWSVSDSSIATIDQNGVLKTTDKTGTITVTATNAETGNKVSTDITIYDLYDFAGNTAARGDLETDGFKWTYSNSAGNGELSIKNLNLTRNTPYVIRVPHAATIRYEGDNVLTSTYKSSDGTPGNIIFSGEGNGNSNILQIAPASDNATLTLQDNGYNNGICGSQTYITSFKNYNFDTSQYYYLKGTVTINAKASGYEGDFGGTFVGELYTGYGIDLTINANTGINNVNYVTVWYAGNLTINAENYGIKATNGGNLYLRDTSEAHIEAIAKDEDDAGVAVNIAWVKDNGGGEANLTGEDKAILIGSSKALELTTNSGYYGLATIVSPACYSVENQTLIDKTTNEPAKKVVLGGTRYTVTYNLEGGSVDGFNPYAYSKYSDDFTLINPKKDGYSFEGWTLDDNDELLNNITVYATETANKQFTAHWRTIDYNITYELNGGTANDNPTVYNIESDEIVLNDPERDYYIFKGWSEGDSEEVSMIGVIPAGSSGEKIFKAHWTPVEYDITYDYNGGSAENPAAYNIESETFTLNKPVKDGYDFANWIINEESYSDYSIESGSHGDLSVSASWTPTVYSISYELDGGHFTKTNPDSYTIESNEFVISDPQKDGYEFSGWIVNDINVGKSYTIPTGTKGNLVLTASWTYIIVSPEDFWLNTYEMSLIAGQSGTIEYEFYPAVTTDQSVIWTSSDESVAVVDANGKVTAVGAGKATITGTSVADESFSDYCEVTVTELTVLFNTNNGETIVPQHPLYGQPVTKPVDPERFGYIFNGWTVNGTAYDFNSPVTNNFTIHAEWTPVEYLISIDTEGGTGDYPTSYTIESEDIILDEPVKEGYRFLGWTGTNGDIPETDVIIPAGSTGAKQYHANWEKLPDSVSLSVGSVTLTLGGTETTQLTAIVLPSAAMDKTVTWSSSDENVATVDDTGLVTAVGEGDAVITAKTVNGLTDTCTVTVEKEIIAVSRVRIAPTSLTLDVGETRELTVTINPTNATDKTLTWQSSDETVATVTENGVVTAVGGGSATITATSVNGKSGTCTVTVNAAAEGPTAVIMNTNLVLEGKIVIQFKTVLSDPDNTDIVIDIEGESTTLPASTAKIEVINGQTQHWFRVPMAAKEMNDIVNIRFIDREGNEIPFTTGSGIPLEDGAYYSVMQYLNNKSGSSNEKLAELCKTMKSYGECAQYYFNYNTSRIDETNFIEPENVDLTNLEAYAKKMEGTDPDGITVSNTNLILKSETTVNFKLTLSSGHTADEYTYTLNGATVEPVLDGSTWMVKKENVAAKDLDTMYTLTISKEGEENSSSYTYGAASYWLSKLNASDSSDTLKNLCRAMYWYNQAANLYFND